MSRFTTPLKKTVGVNDHLDVAILSATVNQKMNMLGAKYEQKIVDRLLFDIQLDEVSNAFEDSSVTLGVGKNFIKAHNLFRSFWEEQGVRMVENAKWENASEVETLRLCLNAVPNSRNLLIISGDTIFNSTTLGFISSGKSSTIYIEDPSCLEQVGINVDPKSGNSLAGVGFDLPKKWGHILFLTGKELEIARKFCHPKNSKMELWELLKCIIRNNGNVYCSEAKGMLRRGYNAKIMGEICSG
jgi:hypothetical protein